MPTMKRSTASKLFSTFACVTVLLLLFTLSATATPLLRVTLPDEAARIRLQALNLDVVWWDREYADVIGWEVEEATLREQGFAFEVETPDLEAFYASRLDTDLDDMGGYATLSEIEDWMWQVYADHPSLISEPVVIGYSLENRPIYAFKVSDNPEQDEIEPELWVNAAIHAREVITPLIVMTFVDSLTNYYETDDRCRAIVDDRELWITPVLNPDGYAWNEIIAPDGGGLWRKNRRGDGETVWGIDLNRNFPIRWGQTAGGASHSHHDQTYCGAEPGSEPETQVMMDFFNSRRFRSVLHYHSYTNVIYTPSGIGWGAPYESAVYALAGEYMTSHLGWDTVFGGVSGGFCDWVDSQADYTAFAFLFEVGGQQDGFWPSAERRPVLIDEQQEPLFRFCELGADPYGAGMPVAPFATLPDTSAEEFTLTWDPSNNLPASGYLMTDVGQLVEEGIIDDVEVEGHFSWEMQGFEVTDVDAASGTYAYASIPGPNRTNSLTSIDYFGVEEGDQFTFAIFYDTFPDSDFVAVQVRERGGVFRNIGGNLSTEGNGWIRGTSDGWQSAEFPLDDYVGKEVKVRIEYRTTPTNEGTGVRVDNLSHANRYTLLESDLDVYELDVEFEDIEEPLATGFILRGSNYVGSKGRWGEAVRTLIWPEGFVSVERDNQVPISFSLSHATPNPFNPTTSFQVTLPREEWLRVELVNILGQRVALFHDGVQAAGRHTITLDGNGLASGIYFIRASTQSHTPLMQKVLLLR
ncbi:immune inhibitor A [bacterium]|nr:immune inhibitor A [bacterium]